MAYLSGLNTAIFEMFTMTMNSIAAAAGVEPGVYAQALRKFMMLAEQQGGAPGYVAGRVVAFKTVADGLERFALSELREMSERGGLRVVPGGKDNAGG